MAEIEYIITEALECEQSGDLETAAELYALYSFKELVESNYQLGQQMRSGLTHMLESISADVRADNYQRSQIHFQIIRPLLGSLKKESDNPAIKGLASEWIGDGYFMLGEEEAIGHYNQALQIFRDLDTDDCLFWGSEPEFDNAYGALKEFMLSINVEYPNTFTMDFEARVEAKIDAFNSKI